MGKSAIRLLTMAIYATTLAAVPAVTSAKAATENGKHMKRHKTIHHSASVGAPKSSTPAWPSMYDDPDRKAAGGGGY